jgi:O-antigen/teichoic acid export membrane protein
MTNVTSAVLEGTDSTQILQTPLTARLLAKNTGFSIFGAAVPLLVAAVGIPYLIKGLGLERFGVLTLAWTLIGYLSLFDLGLGRALTKLIAEKYALNLLKEIPGAFWDSILLLLGAGVFGMIVVAALTPWLVTHVIHASPALVHETRTSFYFIALAIPFVTVGTGLRGFLEAGQQFFYVSLVRIATGMLGFLGPMACLPFSHRLEPVIAALSITRIAALLLNFALCVRTFPALWHSRKIGTTPLRPLLTFGGWLSVSNLLSPIMVSMDRLMISGILSVSQVAFYVAPSEMMQKVLVLPFSLQTVMFPALSAALSRSAVEAQRLYRRSNDAILLGIFPITLVTVLFAREGLRIWLGERFSEHSSLTLQLLAVGILINAMGHIPSILVQSAGRPDLSAKIKLFEVPIYLAFTWWLIVHHGISGAAVAWVLRATMDTSLLFYYSRKWVQGEPFHLFLGVLACFLVGIAFVLSASSPLWVKALFAIAVCSGTAIVAAPSVRQLLRHEASPC